MIGPEIEITEEEAHVIARGLLTVARCDGTFDEREKLLIEGLLPMPIEGLADIGPDEVARGIRGDAARLFLRSCFLVAFADRGFSDPERQLIERYASALKVSADELLGLAQSVKEWLLSPLSRLANTQGVAEVSKKLPV